MLLREDPCLLYVCSAQTLYELVNLTGGLARYYLHSSRFFLIVFPDTNPTVYNAAHSIVLRKLALIKTLLSNIYFFLARPHLNYFSFIGCL